MIIGARLRHRRHDAAPVVRGARRAHGSRGFGKMLGRGAAGARRHRAANVEDGPVAQACHQAGRAADEGRAGGARAALRDGLPGGQGGDMAAQALHGPVQPRPERRGEAVGEVQAGGDEAQEAGKDRLKPADEVEHRLRPQLCRGGAGMVRR
ncbi:MAG: hypothetical protein IT555_07980 [Acetobacteraceae bacterium]|nr:hypothetical protein [Acetobacteraceae bacterium]